MINQCASVLSCVSGVKRKYDKLMDRCCTCSDSDVGIGGIGNRVGGIGEIGNRVGGSGRMSKYREVEREQEGERVKGGEREEGWEFGDGR